MEEKVEIGVVVDWAQGWTNNRFARSEPPDGVTGPDQLRCSDTGELVIGSVFACSLMPQTEPGFELDSAGVVVYVLDASGVAVWTAGTDAPATTADLNRAYDQTPHGLLCRDLLSADTEPSLFTGPLSGRHEEDAFFWSLVYWSLEGRPSRIDADGDGIPCETLFAADVVAGVLEGGPAPFLLR